MERLTKRGKRVFVPSKHVGYGDLLERLCDYEDAEEQGLLLRLPCPIGTTVYAHAPFCEICESDCKGMRLIDAEAFLEAMEKYVEYDFFDHYKEEPIINISFETLEQIVAEQPTAYDVDAVVEEIKAFVVCSDECAKTYYEGMGCKACVWNKIMELVRKGGVNDNR